MVSELYLNLILEALCSKSNQHEILWNFGRDKNNKFPLTLQQNPHFYESLPTSPDDYVKNFSMSPIESMEKRLDDISRRTNDNIKRIYDNARIDVLTDNLGRAGRVFVKTSRNGRVFGNVCAPKNALIFKGPWPFYPLSHLLTFS